MSSSYWLFITLAVLALAYAISLILKGQAAKKAKQLAAKVQQYVTQSKAGERPVSKLSGKRILILVNPYGGARTAPTMLRDVVMPMCEAAGVLVDSIDTQRAGHAHDIAKHVEADKYAVLVTISGDGMLHEVLNGLADHVDGSSRDGNTDVGANGAAPGLLGSQAICVLPGGTSNGMATSMSSSDIFEATRLLLEGNPAKTDAYSTTFLESGRTVWDCHVFSWGIVAEHDHLVERQLRWMGKFLKQQYAPIHVILQRKTHSGNVELHVASGEDINSLVEQGELADTSQLPAAAQVHDHASEWKQLNSDKFVLFSATNTSEASHDVCFSKTIRHNDGYLDVVVMRDPSRFRLASVFTAMGTGSHGKMAGVDIFRVSEFVMHPAPNQTAYDMSGETYASQGVHVQCHKQCFTFWGSKF